MTLEKRFAAPVKGNWFFLGAFLLLCCVYEYGRVLGLRPQPHHLMRQCDCLGPTYNYYVGDADLFHPWMCNLHADGDTSGESAGEFPLIYWLMGMLWRVIGQSEFAYRLFGVLLHALGSLALFRTASRAIGSSFWGGWIALLFFTSPAIVYFAISFLPDVPAFDLILIGWWFISRYSDDPRRRWLFAAIFTMGIAAMLKVTAGMSFLALFGVLFAESVFPSKWLPTWRLFHRPRSAWLMFIGAIAMVMGWYVYAAYYNEVHNAPYTPNSIWPLWEMTATEFQRAVEFGRSILVFEIFPIPVWIILGSFLTLFVRRLHQLHVQLIILNGALLFGLALFLLGWFQALNNHDYYFINPLIVMVVLSVTILSYLGRVHERFMRNAWTRVFALAVLIFSVVYAAFDINFRTQKGDYVLHRNPLFTDAQLRHWEDNQYWEMRGALRITPTLRALGITPDDRVITITDLSWQNALYLMGQRGWNNYTMYFTDSSSFDRCLRNNARYLLMNDLDRLQRPYMQPYLEHPMGQFENVRIYDLRPLLARKGL